MFSLYRLYNTPQPERRVLLDNVSNFISCVNKSLKAGTVKVYKFCVEFRLDAFRYLFHGKGSSQARTSGMLYNQEDFTKEYFPEDWWIVLDKNGDGCCVDFPVELRPAVKFSSIMYTKCQSTDKLVQKPRSFSEIVYVTLLKKRC